MGCFESIGVPCPKCGEIYWAQSKSGPCMMGAYDLVDCPDDVVQDVNRHAPFRCEKCEAVFEVVLEYPAQSQIKRKAILLPEGTKACYE